MTVRPFAEGESPLSRGMMCGSCKHWKKPAVAETYGECKHISDDSTFGYALAYIPHQPKAAHLATTPQFSCSYWSERP